LLFGDNQMCEVVVEYLDWLNIEPIPIW